MYIPDDIIRSGQMRRKNACSLVSLSIAILVMIVLCVMPVGAENLSVSDMNISGTDADINNTVLSPLNLTDSGKSANLTIQAPPQDTVSWINITPGTAEMTEGGTQVFSAVAYNATGAEIPDLTFAWECSDPSVGTVDSTGSFTAIAPGSAVITVSVMNSAVTGTADLSVAALAPEATPAPAGLMRVMSSVSENFGGVIPAVDDVYLKFSNDGDAMFNDFGDNTFHIRWTGGGLNSLHISDSFKKAPEYGQVTETDKQSGTFYVTTTGGRGYQDDIFLCVAVNGTVPADFKLHIKADGYQWVPNPSPHNPPARGTEHYNPVTIDEWFTKDDLIYGPQTWRPAAEMQYPIYPGQNVSDTSNQFRMMFIDLNTGTLTHKPMRVEYEFRNMETMAAFNVYGYAKNPDTGKYNITEWTNRLTGYQEEFSGWYVSGMPRQPPARMEINCSDFELPLNGKKTLPAVAYDIYDEEIQGAAFEWTSSDTAVGVVDANGLFTPKALGETVVTAKCGDLSDSVTVEVVDAVDFVLDKIVLTPSVLDLYDDDTKAYRYSATGYDQFGDFFPVSSYAWSCTNDTVCEVNETGVMSVIGTGTATVVAECDAVSGTSEVSVRERPDWSLDLVGAVNRTIDRAGFIELANSNPALYTDNKENNWEGVNLSVLVGLVDDSDPATFNQTLASDLYMIFVTGDQTGDDGCSVIMSEDLTSEKTFVVGYRMNGEEIPDRTVGGKMYWPLKLHGSGCSFYGNTLNQVSEIRFSIRPTVSRLEMDAVQLWDDDSELYQIPVVAYDESGAVISDEKYVLNYEWSSSDKSVGTVDEDGCFTVKRAGTTQITASFGDVSVTNDVTVYRSDEDSHTVIVDVNGKSGFRTISDAIEFSQAGDTILVKKGVYAEALNIEKAISIRSESGSDETVIESGVEINSDNVQIKGFTINDDVIVNGFKGCVIDSNSVQGGMVSLNEGSSDCTISNNEVKTGDNTGIKVYNSPNNEIIGNNVDASRYAIRVSSNSKTSFRSIVRDNVVSAGIGVGGGADDSIVDNNTMFQETHYSGFELFDSENITFVNNVGVGKNKCKNEPFYIKGISDSKIYNNKITGDGSKIVSIKSKLKGCSFYLNEITGNSPVIGVVNTYSFNSATPVSYIYNGTIYTGFLGNHISTYTGTDADGDGIGDTPFTEKKVTDNYPLIAPIENYLILTPTELVTTPAFATLDAGESMNFAAVVSDQRGEPMPGAEPVWSVSDPAIGVVNETGYFEALSAGKVRVSAEFDGCTGSSVVRVLKATQKTEDISFEVPECRFNEDKHSISVNNNSASVHGNNVTMNGNGFRLTAMGSSEPVEEGGQINATYERLVLETTPMIADLQGPGSVSGSISANLTGLPAGAGITTTISQNLDNETGSAFQLAASADGLNLEAVAYTMNIRKTNLTNGEDITDATITMTVGPAWVRSHRGVDNIRIIRYAEDGTKQVLETRLIGTDDDGNLVYEAFSPEGLSVFGLVGVSSEKAPSKSSVSTSGGRSNTIGIASHENLHEGDETEFILKNTAVSTITVTPAKDIPKLMLTAERGREPSTTAAPEGAVYQYLEVKAYSAPDNSISTSSIAFSLSAAWFDEQGCIPENVALYRYSPEYDAWKKLDTSYNSDAGEFSAETTEFGYFAIVAEKGVAVTAETPDAEGTPAPAAEVTAQETPSSEATPAQQTPLPFWMSLAALGLLALRRS